jgi:hypothetical protein
MRDPRSTAVSRIIEGHAAESRDCKCLILPTNEMRRLPTIWDPTLLRPGAQIAGLDHADVIRGINLPDKWIDINLI